MYEYKIILSSSPSHCCLYVLLLFFCLFLLRASFCPILYLGHFGLFRCTYMHAFYSVPLTQPLLLLLSTITITTTIVIIIVIITISLPPPVRSYSADTSHFSHFD